jgi:hypothetical protein
LERKGEQEGGERVSLLHAAGGEDGGGVWWRPLEKNPRRAAVRPGEKRKKCGQGMAATFFHNMLLSISLPVCV